MKKSQLNKIFFFSSYGGQLLPGEGEAIASFIQDNKRVPRRGEVGYTPDDIDKFEEAGFVMSGNRHKRMTAVRIRKENQVASYEEQRKAIAEALQEKAKKENQIIANFRELLQRKTHDAHHKK